MGGGGGCLLTQVTPTCGLGTLVSCRQETADAQLHLDGRANANALSKEAGRSDLCCAGVFFSFFRLRWDCSLNAHPVCNDSLDQCLCRYMPA